MHYLENIFLALGSIKANLLRSMLTLLIIAVGITCLVGILTAIDSILFSMSDNFNRLGANSFSVRPLSENLRSNDRGRRKNQLMRFISIRLWILNLPITMEQPKYLLNHSVWVMLPSKQVIKTNPTIRVIGIDENYLNTSALSWQPEEILLIMRFSLHPIK